jgi:hypothetical protein
VVTASEVAASVYGPEPWRRRYGLGLRQENRAALAAGAPQHAHQGVAERVADQAMGLGRVLAVAGVFLLLVLLLGWSWRYPDLCWGARAR